MLKIAKRNALIIVIKNKKLTVGQTWTSRDIKDGIRCLGGGHIPCGPVTSYVRPISHIFHNLNPIKNTKFRIGNAETPGNIT